MNKFAPGQLVVAVNHRVEFLNGCVGEILRTVYDWHGDHVVLFPQFKGQLCPGCRMHPDDGEYLCFSHELKPLDDPDEAMETKTEEELDTCHS